MVQFADCWNPEKNYIIYPEQFPSGVLHLILFDAEIITNDLRLLERFYYDIMKQIKRG